METTLTTVAPLPGTRKKFNLGTQITRDMCRLRPEGRDLRRRLAIEEILSKWPDRFSRRTLDCYSLDELHHVRNSVRLNNVFELEEDASDEVEGWSDPVPVDRPSGQIIIGEDSDPVKGVYSLKVVAKMPSESFSSARIELNTMTREEMAELVRILKPGSTILWGREIES